MPESVRSGKDDLNEAAIVGIAQEMYFPLPIVRRVYEIEFARLKAEARIMDYLALFAARRTRDALRANHN
jgi:hypothetical protein